MKARFNIGLTFNMARVKPEQWRIITDILTTTNDAGEVVNIRYVTKHFFCDQLVMDKDVTDTAIARSLGTEELLKYTMGMDLKKREDRVSQAYAAAIDKWTWKMKYCKERGLSPALNTAWRKAEEEYQALINPRS